MISLPEKLEKSLRDQILSAYEHAVEEVIENGNDEKDYIAKRLPKIIHTLKKRPNCWHAKIAVYAEVLYNYVLVHEDSPKKTQIRPYAIASLFYLCNPFDVIPDYTAGRGYLDDAFVINTCVKTIKKLDRALYEDLLLLLT
jgi:uncharacterized membrane protein YkvA (DUF1232 family)